MKINFGTFSLQNSSTYYWLNRGAPKEKLMVLLPMFGVTYQLANPEQHGLGARVTGPGEAGPFVGKPGQMTNLEICDKFTRENDWTEGRDDEQKGAYRYKGNQWITYDDEE